MDRYIVTFIDDTDRTAAPEEARVRAGSPDQAMDRFDDLNEGTGWTAIAARLAPTPSRRGRKLAEAALGIALAVGLSLRCASDLPRPRECPYDPGCFEMVGE